MTIELETEAKRLTAIYREDIEKGKETPSLLVYYVEDKDGKIIPKTFDISTADLMAKKTNTNKEEVVRQFGIFLRTVEKKMLMAILICEGYALNVTGIVSKEETAKILKTGQVPHGIKPSLHPDRIETLMVHGRDDKGKGVMAVYEIKTAFNIQSAVMKKEVGLVPMAEAKIENEKLTETLENGKVVPIDKENDVVYAPLLAGLWEGYNKKI